MLEIYYGLVDGVHVSLYTKPELNWLQMKELRWSIEEDHNNL